MLGASTSAPTAEDSRSLEEHKVGDTLDVVLTHCKAQLHTHAFTFSDSHVILLHQVKRSLYFICKRLH